MPKEIKKELSEEKEPTIKKKSTAKTATKKLSTEKSKGTTKTSTPKTEQKVDVPSTKKVSSKTTSEPKKTGTTKNTPKLEEKEAKPVKKTTPSKTETSKDASPKKKPASKPVSPETKSGEILKQEKIKTEQKTVQKKIKTDKIEENQVKQDEQKDHETIATVASQVNTEAIEAPKTEQPTNPYQKEPTTISFTVAPPKEKKARRRFSNLETTVLMLLIAALGIAIGYTLATRNDKKNENYIVADPEMQTFLENYNYILENYYGDIDKKDLINAAIAGMLDSLKDPYSDFLDQSTSNTFNVTLKGEYEGLGIEIINDSKNDIYISKVIEQSSAATAGLQVLDKVKSINGISLVGKTTPEFVNLVKNSKDTKFVLVIERKGEEKTFTVEKTHITLQSVTSKMIEEQNKKIGYIQISIFASNTDQQFKRALEELENKGMTDLIIDLRDNSGGHLSAVENMLSQFLDHSKIIYQTETKTGVTKKYSTGNKTKTYPIVILTNENSASASEVMAATLKEQLKATIVGKKTYGKGTVQELQTLPSGDQYKFTTKKWLTPNGNWINEIGIKPDVEVELDKNYYDNPSETTDNQFQTALDQIRKK